jgi:hypothetical protein
MVLLVNHIKSFQNKKINFMKTAIIIFSFFCTLSINGQRLYKDKTTTLSAITENGNTYTQDQKNSNVYWYKRYDNYGESIVQLTFEGNNLKKAIIIHLDPTQTLNRLKDVYAKTNNSEADTFNPPSNGYGKGIASNTPYYSGKAQFECKNNYSSKDYLFIIILLD